MITIPTISALYNGIKTNIETEMSVSIPSFGKVFLNALAGVQAAKLKLFYLALSMVQKNSWVDTAESEANGGTLERYGRIKLGRNPFAATAGIYTVEVTGTIGGVIPAQTTFKSDNSSLTPGKLYVLDTAFTLVTNPDTVNLRALDFGGAGLALLNTLTATAPIALVNKSAKVTVEVTQPLEAEDIEDYRTATINAFRLEPQGGANTDFRLWAADAQGVLRTFPYAKSNDSAVVNLFVEATIADSLDGKGTPTPTILAAVETVVELDPDTTKSISERGRRPLGVFDVNYIAITPLNVNIVVTGYVGNTAAITAVIFAAIKAETDTIRPYISGADVFALRNDTISVNKIIFIIQKSVPLSVFTSLSLSVGGSLLTSYTFTNGDIPYLNSVTYV